jgi:CDP-diacylglycerol--glycerol-3-phosphate 3-phosphatidyltransferase
LTDWARARASGVLEPLAGWLGRLGVGANAVTVVGFLLQVGVSGLFATGRLRWGGVVLSLVAPLDALDGAVARETGSDGPFGAFLDSTLDRLSDAALVLGLAAQRYQVGALMEAALLVGALVFALMVSYTRARAEALGAGCTVGLLTRLERILLIVLLSTLELISVLAWALALLSLVTFLQRVVHVYRVCSDGG